DSRLRRARRSAPSADFATLDEMIRASSRASLTEVEFRDRTADVLGPPRFDEEVLGLYRSFSADWLRPARDQILADEEAAAEVAASAWDGHMRRIGRRANREREKAVLDVL